MNKKNLILFVLLIIANTACDKNDKEPEVKTKLELLTSGSSKTWKVDKGTAIVSGAELDLLSLENPCDLDNEFTLFSNFNYELREGATKCDPNNPDLILSNSWSISEDETSLTIGKFVFLKYELDNAEFVLTELGESFFTGTTSLDFNGKTYDLTVAFVEAED